MQMSEEHMEQQLWAYIDGQCDPVTHGRIASLVASEEPWMTKYAELLDLHNTLSADPEAEHPSLRFVQNVMDAVVANMPAARVRLNARIIKGIAAILLASISVMLVYAFSAVDWRATNTHSNPSLHFSLSRFNVPALVNTLIAVNVLLALTLVDTTLRARRNLGR